MSLRLFAALSLVLVPLSGCLAGVGTMSAQSGVDTAEAHALSLVETDLEPELMGVGSIEPFQRYYDADDDFEVNTYADSVQGDGKIPGWAYGYCIGDDLVVVFLAAGIGVLADVRDGGACDDPAEVAEYAIEGWEIDSDAAAEALAAHPDWPEPTEDTLTFWGLYQFHDEDGSSYPVWDAETGPLDDGPTTYGRVNAQTGEVIAVQQEHFGYDDGAVFVGEGGSCSAGAIGNDQSVSQTLGPLVNPTFEAELPVAGEVWFTVETWDQYGDVTVRLVGPDGEELFNEVLSPEPGGGAYVLEEYSEAAAGPYTLTLDIQLLSAYTVLMEAAWDTCG